MSIQRLPSLDRPNWDRLVKDIILPAFEASLRAQGVDAPTFYRNCDSTFRAITEDGWPLHKTEWSVREVRRHWKAWGGNLAAMLQAAVDGRETKDGRREGSYLESKEYKAAMQAIWKDQKPPEEPDYNLRAIYALRDANREARMAGMPTIAEPDEWLKWQPEQPKSDGVVIPKLDSPERRGGMTSIGEILAGKHKRGPLNLNHPRVQEILEVLHMVLTDDDIKDLWSNGEAAVKARRCSHG